MTSTACLRCAILCLKSDGLNPPYAAQLSIAFDGYSQNTLRFSH
jgi:hypothetical protein